MRLGRFHLVAALVLLWCLSAPSPAPAQSDNPTPGAQAPASQAPVSQEPELVSVGDPLPPEVLTRESFETAEPETGVIGPTAIDYVRVLASLALVIIVIWGLSVLLKRFVTVRGLASSTESLKVLYTLSLSPTRTLYLVRIGERIVLIGAGDGGMRTLAEITEPMEVSTILQELEYKGNFDLNPFRERLHSLVTSPGLEVDEDLDARQRRLKASLDRLKNSGNNHPG